MGVLACGLGITANPMSKHIANIPKFVVSFLLVAAIVNLLVGVFLRYVMVEVTTGSTSIRSHHLVGRSARWCPPGSL